MSYFVPEDLFCKYLEGMGSEIVWEFWVYLDVNELGGYGKKISQIFTYVSLTPLFTFKGQ